jgi:hypothetical protein
MTRRKGSLLDKIGTGSGVASKYGIVVIDEQSGEEGDYSNVAPNVWSIRKMLIHLSVYRSLVRGRRDRSLRDPLIALARDLLKSCAENY